MKRAVVVELLQSLNSQHPFIQFTHKLEKEGSLLFLDLARQRSELMTTRHVEKKTSKKVRLKLQAMLEKSVFKHHFKAQQNV